MFRALALGLLMFYGVEVIALPAQVVIIRHGEKYDTGNELDPQGCERAFLLPLFFEDNPVVTRFGLPVAIYGQRPDSDSGSLRPVQTVAPTAIALSEGINDNFVRKDFTGITNDILTNPAYNGRTVLIAWEHVAIPLLAQAFGLTLTPDLSTWPDAVFDEAWVLSFVNNSPVSLQIVPESVLPGDNPDGGLTGWKINSHFGHVAPVPSTIVQNCQNNDFLNSMLQKSVIVPLPVFGAAEPFTFVN